MTQSDELLEQVTKLKKKVTEHLDKLQEAKVREATAKSKMSELSEQLSTLIGTTDWTKAAKAVEKAAESAAELLQELTKKMKEAGIDPE